MIGMQSLWLRVQIAACAPDRPKTPPAKSSPPHRALSACPARGTPRPSRPHRVRPGSRKVPTEHQGRVPLGGHSTPNKVCYAQAQIRDWLSDRIHPRNPIQ